MRVKRRHPRGRRGYTVADARDRWEWLNGGGRGVQGRSWKPVLFPQWLGILCTESAGGKGGDIKSCWGWWISIGRGWVIAETS